MDREEFEILSKKIRRRLLAVSRNFALEAETEPDDIVQEALMSLWKLVEEGCPIRDAEALAVRITKRVCVAHYRKAKVDTLCLTHDNYTGGTEATLLTDREDLRKVKRFIYAALTPTQREYLRLRNEEGLSLDEIARMTGRPKTSVKSTLSVARRQMLDMIKKQL